MRGQSTLIISHTKVVLFLVVIVVPQKINNENFPIDNIGKVYNNYPKNCCLSSSLKKMLNSYKTAMPLANSILVLDNKMVEQKCTRTVFKVKEPAECSRNTSVESYLFIMPWKWLFMLTAPRSIFI